MPFGIVNNPNPPLIIKMMPRQPRKLKCQHCEQATYWEKTYKLVHCDRPGHPMGKKRQGDKGTMGCWLCPECAEKYPKASNVEPPPPSNQGELFN